MAITVAGNFLLTWEQMLIDGAGESMEAEDNKEMLVLDTYTPNFDTHADRADVTNEVAGTNYTAGGVAVTTTELTIATGTLTFDMADTVYTNVTIASVMAGVYYFNVGTAATDLLLILQDFVTAAGATAADFTIQHAGAGVATYDLTPP